MRSAWCSVMTTPNTLPTRSAAVLRPEPSGTGAVTHTTRRSGPAGGVGTRMPRAVVSLTPTVHYLADLLRRLRVRIVCRALHLRVRIVCGALQTAGLL